VVFDYGEDYVGPTPDQACSGRPALLRARLLRGRRGLAQRPDPSRRTAAASVRTARRQRILSFTTFPSWASIRCSCAPRVRLRDLDYNQPRTVEEELARGARAPRRSSCVSRRRPSSTTRPASVRRGAYVPHVPAADFHRSISVLCARSTTRCKSTPSAVTPHGVDGGTYQWVDLDGEGVAGVLSEQGAWFYRTTSAAAGPPAGRAPATAGITLAAADSSSTGR
jgi:hypothetical protein